MNFRRRSTILLLGAVCALPASLTAAPATAAASASNAVIADCLSHPGGLQGSYTVVQLRHALEVMSPETKEYTSCPDVINRALLVALGKGTSGGASSGGGSGSFLPTPVIIVIVVLVLAAVTLGAIAIRRRRSEVGDGDSEAGDGDSDGPDPPTADP